VMISRYEPGVSEGDAEISNSSKSLELPEVCKELR